MTVVYAMSRRLARSSCTSRTVASPRRQTTSMTSCSSGPSSASRGSFRRLTSVSLSRGRPWSIPSTGRPAWRWSGGVAAARPRRAAGGGAVASGRWLPRTPSRRRTRSEPRRACTRACAAALASVVTPCCSSCSRRRGPRATGGPRAVPARADPRRSRVSVSLRVRRPAACRVRPPTASPGSAALRRQHVPWERSRRHRTHPAVHGLGRSQRASTGGEPPRAAVVSGGLVARGRGRRRWLLTDQVESRAEHDRLAALLDRRRATWSCGRHAPHRRRRRPTSTAARAG